MLVSRLRKTLARQGSPDVIITKPPGYLMSTDVTVDARVFSDLVNAGLRQLASGEAERAAHTLSEGLAQWRTRRLSPFPGESGRIGMARLEKLRLAALEGAD